MSDRGIMATLTDTGPLVALIDRGEERHGELYPRQRLSRLSRKRQRAVRRGSLNVTEFMMNPWTRNARQKNPEP